MIEVIYNSSNNAIDLLGTSILVMDNVSGPNGGEYGHYFWEVRWRLRDKTKTGGYVVQHIKLQFMITNCATLTMYTDYYIANVLGLTKGPQFNYWERWPYVKPGKLGDVGNDVWMSKAEWKNTRGLIKIEGRARWYESNNTRFGESWQRANPQPSGGLAMTTDDPGIPAANEIIGLAPVWWTP